MDTTQMPQWMVVTTSERYDRAMERLGAYLYDHTQIVTATCNESLTERPQFRALVVTAGDPKVNLRYLMNYQAARLGSGMFGVRTFGADVKAAWAEFWGVA